MVTSHLFKAKSLMTLMDKCKNARFRIGTTGTLDGTKTHKLVLEGVFETVFKVTTTKKLMDKKELADLKIICMIIGYSDEQRKLVSKMTYQEEMDFLVSNPERNDILAKLTEGKYAGFIPVCRKTRRPSTQVNQWIHTW